MTINQENLETWLREMETTDKPQAEKQLCEVVEVGADGEPKFGFCCLGLGSAIVPSIGFRFNSERPAHVGDMGYFDGESELAPPAFARWLGVEVRGGELDSDVFIDYPSDLADHTTGRPLRICATAAMLNDAGLTFAQIAQTIRYFGLVEKPYTEGLL